MIYDDEFTGLVWTTYLLTRNFVVCNIDVTQYVVVSTDCVKFCVAFVVCNFGTAYFNYAIGRDELVVDTGQ